MQIIILNYHFGIGLIFLDKRFNNPYYKVKEAIMPYPNEHACRLLPPIKDANTNRINNDREHNGKSYDVIYQEQENGKFAQQAFRYDRTKWSASEAESHCKSHNGTFEAALGKDMTKPDVKILFKDKKKQIVFGVVFEPDFVDAHDEWISKDDIEEAAFNYLVNYRNTKLSHKVDINEDVQLVASMPIPGDMTYNGTLIKAGTWLVAHRIKDNDLWEAIEKDTIVGYSAGGTKIFVQGGDNK